MALIQSHHYFNVSQNGKHVFATSDHSTIYRDEALKLAELLAAKFPSIEGYRITMTHAKCHGESEELVN